ncbi:MAG: ATP-binding protein [Xanthomonadales bacterium]|nr:ATP-binding protein [Xanthomonadales bacterium]
MTLRQQLALLVLLSLALPVIGWHSVREIEAALRESETRAQVAVARALARSVEAEVSWSSVNALRLYVNRVAHPMSVDGFDDDWRPWLGSAQEFESGLGRLTLDLSLASDGRRIFGLAEVTSAAGTDARDQLVLVLADGQTIRVRRGTPENAEIDLAAAEDVGAALAAAWARVDATTYRVEFSVPRLLVGDGLGVVAESHAVAVAAMGPERAGTTRDGAAIQVPMVHRSLQWSRRLDELAPPGARLWLLDDQGWVLGAGGRLSAAADLGTSGWARRIYEWIIDDIPRETAWRDPNADLRLDSKAIALALRGQLGVALAAPEAAGTVLARVAVPLRSGGRIAGVMLYETATEELLLATNRAFAGTVLASAAAVVLLALGLLWFAGRLSLRIRRLRDATEAIGDAERPRLPGSGDGDEIGDLARSFEKLLHELGVYNRYLQSLSGRLAHELGTPLAVVRSSLDNLQHESLQPEAARYADRARSGAERLRSILQAMSEAQRLEQAVAQVDRERFDLCDVIRGCFEGYRAVAPDFSWKLELVLDRFPVAGSPELIAQALDKLVDNARSFTPPGGLIRLSLEPKGQGAVVRVANDGPQLPEELGGRLFDSMVSVREGREGFHLGLGLHIVRLIVRAHGGKTTARNRSDGQGAEFSLWFPRKE